jgi:hypothetical protein
MAVGLQFAPFLREGERREQGVGGRRNGGNKRAAADAFSAGQNRRRRAGGAEAAFQPQFDPPSCEHFLGVQPQTGGNFAIEDAFSRVQQHDAQFVEPRDTAFPGDLADKVVQFGAHLDSRKTAPGDDECEQLASQFGIGLDGRLVEHANQVIAQRDGVPQVLEGHGVLVQPGEPAKVGDVAQRQHEMIVREFGVAAGEAGLQPHHPALQIDGFDFADEQLRAWEQLVQRTDSVEQADFAGDHLGKHRLECKVVFL